MKFVLLKPGCFEDQLPLAAPNVIAIDSLAVTRHDCVIIHSIDCNRCLGRRLLSCRTVLMEFRLYVMMTV